MKVLITGGLGFLGQHLARQLLRAQPAHQLTIVDDMSSPGEDPAWLRGKAEVVVGDFLAMSTTRSFDRIYHLASPVGSLGILAMSGYVAKRITDLAVHAGEMAAACGASLLYVSSSEVYGRHGEHVETDELAVSIETGARMEYSLGKLAGENLLRNLAARHRFRLTLVRPFNVLGEGQSSRIGFVVPTFFEHALAGRALPLFHGGAQVRCFCHAEDVVRGLVAIQESGGASQTYNLGHPGNAVSIRDLAVRIRALCRSDSALEAVDPVQHFGPVYLEASAKSPSIAKVHADTGWWPALSLDDALERVHAHYVNRGAPALALHPDRVAET